MSARFRAVCSVERLLPPDRFRFTFRSRLHARGRLAVPPGRHVVGALDAAGARFRALAAPSFSGPLHQPGAGIPAGTDEMFVVLHLLSHGASRRTINYYGRFYRSELVRLLKRINEYLVRWARWKYKRLRRYPAKARRFLAAVYRREPGLFAHWRFGARPDGWTMGAG